MPRIFTQIDSAMKQFYMGRRTETLGAIPPGVVVAGERWVETAPIKVSGALCVLRGKIDALFGFDDGSVGVVDFKTSGRNPAHLALYSRQLHSYAMALEVSSPRGFKATSVSKLGLLVFDPAAYAQSRASQATLTGAVEWIEIARDDTAFMRFLCEVVACLEDPIPAAARNCEWCSLATKSDDGRAG